MATTDKRPPAVEVGEADPLDVLAREVAEALAGARVLVWRRATPFTWEFVGYVVGAMRAKGWYLTMLCEHSPDAQAFEGSDLPRCIASFERPNERGGMDWIGEPERADTLPAAVAEAALTALTGTVKEERAALRSERGEAGEEPAP